MTGKFVPSEKKNCRTSDWKILVPSEKRRAEHVTGKFWCRQKKTTAEHKADACTKISGMMHVRKFWCCQKKRTAKHVTGKFWCCRKKQLQNTWLENVGAVGKKRTAKHVTGKFWYRRKKRTHDWKICAVRKPWNTWLKKLLAFEKNICLPPNQIGNFYIMFTNSRRNYCNGMCSQMASANRQFEISP